MQGKIIKLILSVLFTMSAIVQFNDPDPWIWVTIYATMAIVTAISAFRKIPSILPNIIIVLLSIFSFFLLPEIIEWINKGMPSITGQMKVEEAHIEYAREFFGLLICLAASFFIAARNEVKTTSR